MSTTQMKLLRWYNDYEFLNKFMNWYVDYYTTIPIDQDERNKRIAEFLNQNT